MGNHSVGRMFHAAFSMIEEEIDAMDKDQLLAKLDKVGDLCRSTDAEFDDYASPSQPLGKALVKIFNPGFVRKEDDEDNDEWYETVYLPFRKRYEFY